MTRLKAFFKRLLHRHKWQRYDVLVEQLMVGGYYAWQRCAVCRKIKFDSASWETPEEPGWMGRKAEIAKIIGWTK